jgi:hypothetical protein
MLVDMLRDMEATLPSLATSKFGGYSVAAAADSSPTFRRAVIASLPDWFGGQHSQTIAEELWQHSAEELVDVLLAHPRLWERTGRRPCRRRAVLRRVCEEAPHRVPEVLAMRAGIR